jgi:hypothetical protein
MGTAISGEEPTLMVPAEPYCLHAVSTSPALVRTRIA